MPILVTPSEAKREGSKATKQFGEGGWSYIYLMDPSEELLSFDSADFVSLAQDEFLVKLNPEKIHDPDEI